jgi:hypothetical protein
MYEAARSGAAAALVRYFESGLAKCRARVHRSQRDALGQAEAEARPMKEAAN